MINALTPESILWLFSVMLCIYLLRTKWLDTSRRGINLSLTFLTLSYACMFTDSLNHQVSSNWETMASLFSLISLLGWSLPKIKANFSACLARKVM